MIRFPLRFAFLWPLESWQVRTRELNRANRGLVEAAERLVERAINKARRDRFLAAVTDWVNDTLLPQLAAERNTTLPEDTTERRILRAVVRRDFLYTWLVNPAWRAQCSYAQLLQSRVWVTRVARGADPLAQPFVADVCRLETDVKQAALQQIADVFVPALRTQWATLVRELADAGFGANDRDRRDVVMAATVARLRETILDEAERATDALVGRGA